MTPLTTLPGLRAVACTLALLGATTWAQTLEDMTPGQMAAIEFEIRDGKWIAIAVELIPGGEDESAVEAHVTGVDPKARTFQLGEFRVHVPEGVELQTRRDGPVPFKDLLGRQADVVGELVDGKFVAARVRVKERDDEEAHLGEVEAPIGAVGHDDDTVTVLGHALHLTKSTKYAVDWETLNGMLLAERVQTTGAALVRRYDTWTKTLQVADVAGLTYLHGSRSFVMTDSEIEKGSFYKGRNTFEMHADGRGGRTWSTSAFSGEPTGICYHPRRKTFFITDDDERAVFEADLDFRKINSFDTIPFGARDPEGVTCNPITGDLWVACGKDQMLLRLSPEGELKETIKLRSMNVSDAEGIAYDLRSNRLMLVSGGELAVFALQLGKKPATSAIYSLLSLGCIGPQAAAFAPSSDPADKRGTMHLFVGDAMAGEVADGSVFELALVHWRDDGDVRSNMVGATDGFGFRGDEAGFKESDRNGNGRLDFGEHLPNLDGKGGIRLYEGYDAFDNRRDKKKGVTDRSLVVTEKEPLRYEHTFDVGPRRPAMARLKLVVADARGMPGKRSEVRVDGKFVGVIAGATASHMADGAVVHGTFYFAGPVLAEMLDGAITVEIRRPDGSGPDDIAIDSSLLEWVVGADS